VPTIDIYFDDEELRRRRGKWLIPLLIGVLVAVALQREKPPTVPITPPERVRYRVVFATLPSATPPLVLPSPTPPPLPAHLFVTPSRIDFGDALLAGRLPAKMATISNDGGQPLSVASAIVAGPFLSTSGCEHDLAPGEKCTIAIVFAPTEPGGFDGALRLAAGGQRAKVSLHGSIRPDLDTLPQPVPTPPPAPPPAPVAATPPTLPTRSLCFNPLLLRFTSPGNQSITLTNPENAPLRVIAVEPIGTNGQRLLGYKIDAENCLRVLNAGESCTFTIHANIIAVKLRATMQVAVYHVDPATGGKAIARVASDCR